MGERILTTVLGKMMDSLDASETEIEYRARLEELKETLAGLDVDNNVLKKVNVLSGYMENKFSYEDTLKNMKTAKERVLSYLTEQMSAMPGSYMETENRILCLQEILEKFDLFMEAFFEKEPHGKAGIDKRAMRSLEIKNEYDVQHILYALLKPLFPEARTEVPEDTGFSMVRTDIWIKELSAVIEIKCSRDSMSIKKLTEEIAADMVHYQAEHIFFFLYDKNKIIDNPYAFRSTYQRVMDGKDIRIIIHQPKTL